MWEYYDQIFINISAIEQMFIIKSNQVQIYNTHFASMNTILICKKSFVAERLFMKICL